MAKKEPRRKDSFSDEERKAIHALLTAKDWRRRRGPYYWSRTQSQRLFSDSAVARMFGTSPDIVRRINKEFEGPAFRTQFIEATVLVWAKKHKRWPRGEDWADAFFPFSRTTFSRRFMQETRERWWDEPVPDAMTEFQRYLLRTHTDSWVQRNLTPQLIFDISNLTIRRDAVARYGAERLIRKGGGVVVQEDEYGKLWSLPTDNHRDERTLYVEVVNNTKNPDGTFDHYYLRVPPQTVTARQGVAWTFQLKDTNPAVPLFSARS